MSAHDIPDSLDILLNRLTLNPLDIGDLRGRQYQELAYIRAAGILRVSDDERSRRKFELRLRLALHLAPATAIAYDKSNPVPRWQLIRDHLVAQFRFNAAQSESLARDVAIVLDNWHRKRDAVSTHRSFLRRRDGPQCAQCKVEFDSRPRTLIQKDPYKPYYLSPDELLSPEVDHIEAVSALGTNELQNLQLLCRLCNGGKGDGLGIDIRHEAKYAGETVAAIPRQHRASMLYYVIDRDNRRCVNCGAIDQELTIRPLVTEGGFVRSNLQTLCVNCV